MYQKIWPQMTAAIAALAAATLTLSACGGGGGAGAQEAESGGPTSVTMACPASTTGIPIQYAMENGIDEKHNIKISCVNAPNGPEQTAAMLSGEIDINGLNPSSLFPILDAGGDLVAFQPVLDREFFDILVRKDFPLPHASDGWKGVMGDLSNAKIGVVARGAAAEIIAKALFKFAGVSDENVTYLPTGLPPTTLAALSNGQTDAAITFEPGITNAIKQGFAVQPFSIQDLSGPAEMDWGSMYYTSLRKYAQDNPETIKNFQATYLEALAQVKDPENESKVSSLAQKWLNISPDVAEDLLERNMPYYSNETTVRADRYDQVGELFNKSGLSKKAWKVTDYGLEVTQ